MMEGSAVESDCTISEACYNGSSPAGNGTEPDGNSLPAECTVDSSGK